MNNNDLANNSQYVTKCFVCGGGDSSRGSGCQGHGEMLYFWERTSVPTSLEVGWAPSLLVWTSQRQEKSLVPAGIQDPDHPAHSIVTIRIMLSQLHVYIILMSKGKIKSLNIQR